MIRAHRRQLEAICRQRGYALEQAMACVVSQDGDIWTIDEQHPSYPRRVSGTAPVIREAVPYSCGGPGTELKRLLGRIGITASPTCSCAARARQMDALGCEWCEANVDTIVGWLREEAAKRSLPFLDAVGKLLVRRAISNARKEAERAEAQGESPPAF
jgi:hypothetical protein